MKNISNTIYDDVFRTLINDCKYLLIPLVNEIFKCNYEGDEDVILKQNEILLKQQKNIQKRITDTSFAIRSLEFEKNYHLECQSKVDGSIMIRMYEYDSQIARNNYELYDETLYVNFPMSAIIYLRSYNNTTDMLKICIKTSDGNQIHNIPILKIRNYDIESIFCKRLLFLIPFYIFNYESELNIIDNNVKKYEELMNTYKKIVNGLDSLHEQAFIDEYTKITLFELTKMVVNNLADKYKNIKKGVSEIMGGKILDHPAKTIRNEGIEEGRREGVREGRKEGRTEGRKDGREEGRKEGILAYINLSKKFNVEDKEIFESIVKEFNVSEDYVREFFMNDF
ncbi:MAG: hypothetical protein IJA34_16520 [Lachnospiraceae bacterium]|nr:hypothetical protein [Lachnospiraceae bacterium]